MEQNVNILTILNLFYVFGLTFCIFVVINSLRIKYLDMQKLLLSFALLCISVWGYSQYQYKICVDDSATINLKKAYSEICKRIEFTDRKIVDGCLVFKSKNKYSEEKMEEIVMLANYELTLFNITVIDDVLNPDKK